MEKIKVLLFSLSVCLLGSNHLSAQDVFPISRNATSEYLIVRYSPGSDYLTLELIGDNKSRPFRVFSLDGKEVYEGRISGTQLLEVSTWNPGTYFVIYGSQREKFLLSR